MLFESFQNCHTVAANIVIEKILSSLYNWSLFFLPSILWTVFTIWKFTSKNIMKRWKCNLFMRNKLSRVGMKCCKWRLDLMGCQTSCWDAWKRMNLSKAKPIIQITFNFQSMWNCIIIKSSSGRLCVRVFAASLRNLMAAQTQTHTRTRTHPCIHTFMLEKRTSVSTQHFTANLSTI